jgi:4-hydroxy-tetrahydrodipicolinate synthase
MADCLIEGSFVALITPMNADGTIDFEGFRTLINLHEENGTSAILFMGSTGEVSMLSLEERHAIVRETMKFRNGKISFYYGCTGTTTASTIDYVRQAAAEGADGAIIAAPAYICASNEDIVQFCLDVADQSSIPLGFYNNPPRVGTDLKTEDLLRIAAHPRFVVLKESTTRVGQVAQVCAATCNVADVLLLAEPRSGGANDGAGRSRNGQYDWEYHTRRNGRNLYTMEIW